MRTCGLCKAEYEWGVHVAGFSAKAGFNEQQISDTASKHSNLAIWNSEQQLLIQLAGLIMLAGLYRAVSFMVNACRIEQEPFAPAFP